MRQLYLGTTTTNQRHDRQKQQMLARGGAFTPLISLARSHAEMLRLRAIVAACCYCML